MFLLAHLSDPHLGPLPRPRLAELIGKPGLALVNIGRRRRPRHDMAVLAELTRDLLAQSPHHVAVTGDLVNLGIAAEFAPARRFLERLGPAGRVSLVPGNHDVYVRATAGQAGLAWADYMRGDDGRVAFPYVRRRGPVAIVGVSSAVPTWLFSAAGRVGSVQADALVQALGELGAEGLFRVVLVHHCPAENGAHRLRRLRDAAILREAIGASGAELVLHGHHHRPSRFALAGPAGPVPVIGVASASATPTGHDAPAGYNLYAIERAQGAWRCTAIRRARGAEAVTEVARFRLW